MEQLTIIILILVALVAIVYLPNLLVKRTAKKIIRLMQMNNALDPKSARSPYEMNVLEQRPLINRIIGTRDYKPQALDVLIKMNIVKTTDDERIYLSEEELSLSPFAPKTQRLY